LKLTLNLEKTHITHVNDGFVFLGHRVIRKRSGRDHMRPVTGIPRENANRISATITQLLSSNYSVPATEMIDRINQIISGWSAFYRHTSYSAHVMGRLDTIVFWKLGHWLARKYRTRVNKLMRKWYRRSDLVGVRTWIVSHVRKGTTFTATLEKFSGRGKDYRPSPAKNINPYLQRVVTAAGGHRSYAAIATITDT